ncbi:MAG: hypothetical protein ABSB95_15620 [Dissulfurispiraceae bacterium]|jgi:hypothetical protein
MTREELLQHMYRLAADVTANMLEPTDFTPVLFVIRSSGEVEWRDCPIKNSEEKAKVLEYANTVSRWQGVEAMVFLTAGETPSVPENRRIDRKGAIIVSGSTCSESVFVCIPYKKRWGRLKFGEPVILASELFRGRFDIVSAMRRGRPC